MLLAFLDHIIRLPGKPNPSSGVSTHTGTRNFLGGYASRYGTSKMSAGRRPPRRWGWGIPQKKRPATRRVNSAKQAADRQSFSFHRFSGILSNSGLQLTGASLPVAIRQNGHD